MKTAWKVVRSHCRNILVPASIAVLLAIGLSGCATTASTEPALMTIDPGNLPVPDIALNIPGLGPCTDSPDRTVQLHSQLPVTVLVHGCFGSAGLFRALAQVHAFHGQQTACFTYNDRDSLMVSSTELRESIELLAQKMRNKKISVIGHSQGGLIARKALVVERPDPVASPDVDLRLITVSAPFAGIASAEQCGSEVTNRFTFGLVGLLCKLVTGDKWHEITSASNFIREPGRLVGQVKNYLKIATDERGSCREADGNGVCMKDDFVFTLDEQRHRAIDQASDVKIVEVKAGHVEIVGDNRVIPRKLISILQENGILNPTEERQSAAFHQLLEQLYLAHARSRVKAR